ncbi:phasin family protein [Calothrix sp. CCY 0018]|uniref:phasin family protein n=1 Tax=Calothrix sp. CCY 0018 TaxID=3103864 RepID=UPI0039C60A34
MPGFGDIAKKAFYLGVGLASYASEKAGGTLAELRSQAQKLADEMVAKGEMNSEEARKFVEDMMKQAQTGNVGSGETTTRTEPRRIEILDDGDEPTEKEAQPQDVDKLRDQVKRMQEELRRLQRDK